MSPSRSALLTSNIDLTDHDGKSLRLLGLAKLLAEAGYTVTLLVAENSSEAAKKYSVFENGTRQRDTIGEDLLRKIRYFVKQLIGLLSFYLKLLISHGEYDLIGSSLAGFEIDSLLACMLSKIRRVPFIYDYDDPSPELRIAYYGCSTNDPRVRLSRFTRNVLSRNANLILTASDSIRHQMAQRLGGKKRIAVWYNLPRIDEISMTGSKLQLREKLGLKKGFFIVSYLGRVPSWGIEPLANLIIAFAQDFRHDDNVLFLIIGGGQWEERYRRIVHILRQTDRIIITGVIPRKNALEYLLASDVSCIPFAASLASEHLAPTKLFEAMALGIPVLCPHSRNFVEILGNDGIYFNGNLHDITSKIRWCLMNSSTLEEISPGLKSRFVNKYGWEKRSIQMENILRQIDPKKTNLITVNASERRGANKQ